MGWLILLLVWLISYIYLIISSLFSQNAFGFAFWLVIGGFITWIIWAISTTMMFSDSNSEQQKTPEEIKQEKKDKKELKQGLFWLIIIVLFFWLFKTLDII